MIVPPRTSGKAEGSFRFVMDAEDAPAELDAIDVSPSRLLTLEDGTHLGLFLLPVTEDDAAHFESRNHMRADGTRLRCTSFYVKRLEETAFAALTTQGAVAALDANHVARMVCVCDRLTPVLQRVLDKGPRAELDRDVKLVRLLRRLSRPDWVQANEIAKGYPDVFKQGAAYGGYMAVMDLVRLIWIHEWAHVILGHVGMVEAFGNRGRLDEHSPTRNEGAASLAGVPWPQVLQGFELHADKFAVTFATEQILSGYDPVGAMTGPNVNIVHRICVLAAACAVIAVDSELKQGALEPGTATHPSASMRYMCMLHQIESVCAESDPSLGDWVRVYTYNMINDLTTLSEDFYGLLYVTPMLAKTPQYKSLIDVSDYLFQQMESKIDPLRQEYIFLPQR